MASASGAQSFARCQYCRKEATPTRRIRACTRCHSVGYCSKACQASDWPGRDGHKTRCRPRKPNDGEVVTLQVKRGDGDGEDNWEDAGPINLIDEMGRATINSDQRGCAASMPSDGASPKASFAKELPAATQKILGSESSNNYIYRHSADGVDENLLIFFQGAGDTNVPFDTLGTKMQLPQTATLSISASASLQLSNGVAKFVELPFGLGYTWFDEMDYMTTGETLLKDHPRRLQSLNHAVEILEPLLCSLIGIDADGGGNANDATWIPERVFLFGFSAGACLAMEICKVWMNAGRMPLGGAICVAGGISSKYTSEEHDKSTDVLIVAGSNDTVYTKKDAQLSQKLYPIAIVSLQKGKGHSMIESKGEMQVVMEFLSKRLVRRMISMGA
ncbi:hypothetical protein ACHAXT_003103 [Thalassiosira profunda]